MQLNQKPVQLKPADLNVNVNSLPLILCCLKRRLLISSNGRKYSTELQARYSSGSFVITMSGDDFTMSQRLPLLYSIWQRTGKFMEICYTRHASIAIFRPDSRPFSAAEQGKLSLDGKEQRRSSFGKILSLASVVVSVWNKVLNHNIM